MFSFIKNIFGNKNFSLNMSRQKEIDFCDKLGQEISDFKRDNYDKYTWNDIIDKYCRDITDTEEEYNRLVKLMSHFVLPKDKRLEDDDTFYKSAFPSKKIIDKRKHISSIIKNHLLSIKDSTIVSQMLNKNDLYTSSTLDNDFNLLEIYDIPTLFKDWVKQTELKDHAIYSSLYYLYSMGILDKKKEKNRVYYKYSGKDINSILNDNNDDNDDIIDDYLDNYLDTQVYTTMRDIDNRECIRLKKSQKSTNSYYDILIESDFFDLGKGIYPLLNTPFIYDNHVKCMTTITIKSPMFVENNYYEKIIKNLRLLTYNDFT